MSNGIIYLLGQVEQPYEDSDMSYEFRQRRYFFYLSGANFPGCAVTYDIGKDELILWIPYSDPKRILWYGRTPSIEECKSMADVDDVRYNHGLSQYLNSLIHASTTTLYVLHPDQTPPDVGSPPPYRASFSLGPKIDTTRLQPAMDAARVIKTPYEIAMIRKANDISSAAHRAVAERLKSFTNEREIAALFKAECTRQAAPTLAYATIAGSGPNASVLHYVDNDEDLKGRQLVVVDAGCEWNCYASDITRTLPIPGPGGLSDASRAILRAVERMQSECIAKVKPGITFKSLDEHAHAVAVEELLRAGVLRGGTKEDILAQGTSAAFFPHGLGHHVGLETHDVSGKVRLLMPRIVPGGMVTTAATLGLGSAGSSAALAGASPVSRSVAPGTPAAAEAIAAMSSAHAVAVGAGASRAAVGVGTGRSTTMVATGHVRVGSSDSTASTSSMTSSSSYQPVSSPTLPSLPPPPPTPPPSSRRRPASWLFEPPAVAAFKRHSVTYAPTASTIASADIDNSNQGERRGSDNYHQPQQTQQLARHASHHEEQRRRHDSQLQTPYSRSPPSLGSTYSSSGAARPSTPSGATVWTSAAAAGSSTHRRSRTALAGQADAPALVYGATAKLEPGMVVTVEPGIYFCRPYIAAFFLSNDAHSRYIDRDVLETFYDVGGVRFEDDILVTEDGYENLTTAPKGAELYQLVGVDV